jgi:hypothetical protein
MEKPSGSSGPEERELQEQCDGCGQLRPASCLVPIGDGSIRVCQGCYASATAMVFTRVACSCSV